MLNYVAELHAVYPRDGRDCGGGEHNRTYMAMKPPNDGSMKSFQEMLYDVWLENDAGQNRFPAWERTEDLACYVDFPFSPDNCPHWPFQLQIETDDGHPRAQINFFRSSDYVIVYREYLDRHEAVCDSERKWGSRTLVCNEEHCFCNERTGCPGPPVEPDYCAVSYRDTVVSDSTSEYTRGPANPMHGAKLTFADPLMFEMDQDYNGPKLNDIHSSAPSCSGFGSGGREMRYLYADNYGDPGWYWNPPNCEDDSNDRELTREFADRYLVAGASMIRAVHLTELRERVDALRLRFGLSSVDWVDTTIVPGVTSVRAVHLTELRSALNDVYVAANRDAPVYRDGEVMPGVTPIEAAHWAELRQAVLALE